MGGGSPGGRGGGRWGGGGGGGGGAPHDRRLSPRKTAVRAKGLEPPRCFHQQDLNLPRLPFRHARVLLSYTPRSLRSRSTWPVALTAYRAFSILPSASMTNVERITPMIV